MKDTVPVRFIADAMVARLGRWLRILGYDVATFYRKAHQAENSRKEIIQRAIREDRIILTRDAHLLKHKELPPHCFILNDRLKDQLNQVLNELHLQPQIRLTRCLDCNLSLESIPKEAVQTRIPPYVFKTQTEFCECPKCNKIFWEGTHVERIFERIKQLQLN